ncbi:hypothetical protein quinque_008775 [Culex quinquefasciatus]
MRVQLKVINNAAAGKQVLVERDTTYEPKNDDLTELDAFDAGFQWIRSIDGVQAVVLNELEQDTIFVGRTMEVKSYEKMTGIMD